MKARILSDLHIEFADLTVHDDDVDLVIAAGDIHLGLKGIHWLLETYSKPIVYVLGNHEYYKGVYPKTLNKMREASEGTHLHLLENDSIQLGEIAFFGCTLWTDFNLFGNPEVAGYSAQQVMNDFKKIRRLPNYSKLRSVDAAIIHKRSITWLDQALKASEAKYKVVVTHHAPSKLSLPERRQDRLDSAAYASNLDAFIEEHQPDLWCHGHIHHCADYQIGNTRVIANPRGYPDEPNLAFNVNHSIDLTDI